jgi:hypothetical protein
MKYRFILLGFLLLIIRAGPALAATGLTAADTGSCTTVGACLVVPVNNNSASVGFAIGANASGNTIQFEGCIDSCTTAANWTAVNVYPTNSTTAVTSSTSANVNYRAAVSGLTQVRVRMSTLVSGTTYVSIAVSSGAVGASIGGGGGSFGPVTGTSPISVATGTTTPVISCPTCNTSSATVSNVTGTANEIDVATGTTTPALSIDSAFIFPGTAVGKSISGIGDTALYTGSTLDLRAISANTDATTLANGNTTGIFNSQQEPSTQTIATTIPVGTSGNASTTWFIPNNSAWTCTVTSGPCVQHYGQSSIISQNPTVQGGGSLIELGGSGNPTYLYTTSPTNSNGDNYYYVLGLNLKNFSQATSTGIGAYLGGTARTYDVSDWEHMNVGDEFDTYAVKVYNTCCQAGIFHSTINANYSTASPATTPLFVSSDSSGGEVGWVMDNSTIGHPGATKPEIQWTDTNSAPTSTGSFNQIYMETSNSDTTTALVNLNGCGAVNFSNIDFRAEVGSDTAGGFQISNTNNCILTLMNINFTNGSGNFELPVLNAVVDNDVTAFSQPSDSAGHIGFYSNTHANYFRSLHLMSTDLNTYTGGGSIDAPTNAVRITGYGANSTTYGEALISGQTSSGSAANYFQCNGTTTAGSVSCLTGGGVFAINGSQTTSPATGIVATAIASGTSTGVGFASTSATSAHVYRGICHIVWQQLTAASTVTFGLGASSSPTGLWASSESSPGAYSAPYVAGNITNTTITAVTPALVPSASATNYTTDIYALLSATSTETTVTVYAATGNSSDAINITAGSYCTWY